VGSRASCGGSRGPSGAPPRARNRREREAARSEHQPPDQETLARRLDLQAWLGARLRALPHEQAHALALRYGEDLAPGEIARHLGVPEATVKTRLRRGLAALREGLDTEHGREEWRLALAPTLATSGYDAGPDVGHEVGSCKPGAHTAPAGGAAHAGATLAGFGGLAGALLVAAAAVVGVLFVGLWGGAPDDGVAAGRSALAPRVEARSPPTASIVERAPLDELTVASDGPGGAPSIATSSIRSEASSPDDLTTSGIEPVSTALPSEPAGAGTATVRVIFEHDSLDDEGAPRPRRQDRLRGRGPPAP
jgi:hypothetical protein